MLELALGDGGKNGGDATGVSSPAAEAIPLCSWPMEPDCVSGPLLRARCKAVSSTFFLLALPKSRYLTYLPVEESAVQGRGPQWSLMFLRKVSDKNLR